MWSSEAIDSVQRADWIALFIALIVGVVASCLVLLARRLVLSRTSFALVVNTVTVLCLIGVVALVLECYVETSTVLIRRALIPLAEANARYLGNPETEAQLFARERANTIAKNEPGPSMFVCNYPGWTVQVGAVISTFLGALLGRFRFRGTSGG